MANHLENLVELQRELDLLRSKEVQLDGVPEWMEELHREHSERKGEIDQLQQAVDEAASLRRTAEAEATDHREKLTHYQGQISRVQTQREYGALLQEIDTAKAQIQSLEDGALGSLEAQETAQKELDEKQAAFEELNQRHSTELKKWESEKPQVRQEVAGLQTTTDNLREQLPKPVLAQFLRLFDRYEGQAVASVRKVQRPGGKGPNQWHCAACNYRVRPQMVVEIRTNGSAVNCDGCRRFLFYAQEEAAE